MNVEIKEEGGKTYVIIAGRLDTVNSHEFEKQIIPLTKRPQLNVVLDCAKFDYISSSGLRQFLFLQKSVTANQGELTIKHMKPEIREIFDMTGFSNIFTIEP